MEKKLDELVEEALSNIKEDRDRILGAYEKTKEILDSKDVDAVEAAGNTVVKLLESLIKSNEQIIKLAQIKEREESKKKETKNTPLDIDEISDFFDSRNVDGNN